MRKLAIALAFCVGLTTLFLSFGKSAFVDGKRYFTVVVDAGHGGIDGGAVGRTSGVCESEINLDIAKRLKEKLEEHGIAVVMTRSDPAGLYGVLGKGFKQRDLKKRVEIANAAKADALVSIHLNEYPDTSRRGAQVFYKGSSEEGRSLADAIQSKLNEMKESPRKCTALTGDYYILNETSLPAVICECGFLSNEEDEALLTDDAYRDALAQTVYLGLIDYFVGIVRR